MFSIFFQVNQADDISDVGKICRFVQLTSKILFQWKNIWMSSPNTNTISNFLNFIFAMIP